MLKELFFIATTASLLSCAIAPPEQELSAEVLQLELGAMSDYGASPWYTADIAIGENTLKLSPDSGAAFIWATADVCTTTACDAHHKVDTSQAGFTWVDKTPTERSFGPWGSMYTMTGAVDFNNDGSNVVEIDFFASVKYTGAQFEYLAWDGGIGFPSTSAGVTPGSDFYFNELLKNGLVNSAEFSMVTDLDTGRGQFILGKSENTLYDPSTAIRLEPNTSGSINYIWGTDLYSTYLGNTSIPSLTDARFYLDSGSSLFKGDSNYITPILELLYQYTDGSGDRIFDKVFDGSGQWVSLVYSKNRGPNDFPSGTLPDLSLMMGQSCNAAEGLSAKITLSPEQFSYYVEIGEREGNWVPAFSVLNGVGGLLVGSTFMDLFYTTFQYQQIDEDTLNQGDMYLYLTSGERPSSVVCITNDR